MIHLNRSWGWFPTPIYLYKRYYDNTAETLVELIESVNKVTTLILDIDSASKYQVNFIEQIHSGILEISDVVQSNSAIAEESAASSEELTVQAETLNKMVGQFKIK